MKSLWNLHVRKRGTKVWFVVYPFPYFKDKAVRVHQHFLLDVALARPDLEISLRKVDVPGYTPPQIKEIDAKAAEFFPITADTDVPKPDVR